jgi:BirA family biotin operon repressor/biotin-[acetyl-CoA-carboxylase] ligase
MNFTILRFESLDSTNLEALRQARRGAAEGLCVIARQQRAGRGRQGRTWSSPKNAGFYCSIVVRPRLNVTQLPLITLATAVAVHDAMVDRGLPADIKWPNDILVGEKKICGILAEATETISGLAIVVGIGINLTSGNFPDDVADVATSIEAETGNIVSPAVIERSVLKFFGYFYERLTDGGRSEILTAWARRSTYYSNRPVRVALQGTVIEGITDGLDQYGGLRVRTSDGNVVSVQAGDVERLRNAG